MAADGRPEPAALRCGAAIARLRTLHNLSRAQLLARLYDQIDPADEQISMAWLARLENGRIVKVARSAIEALCRALGCTPRERAWLLLQADRNLLASADDQPAETAELLSYALDQLHRDAPDILAALLGSRRACALNELEVLELTAAALECAIARRRGEQATTRDINGNDTYRALARR